MEPMALAAGESVLVALRSHSSEEAGTHLAWTAVHFDAGGASKARQALDLNKGWIP
jgi:protein arginine N-methyltransferase 1